MFAEFNIDTFIDKYVLHTGEVNIKRVKSRKIVLKLTNLYFICGDVIRF